MLEGNSIGKHDTLEQIGRGGQGTVYFVRDTDLDRKE
tara:strand:+ start:136 stop:246 length:111 start_codon:yes stop_codon:yes gene_type:complete